MTGPVRGVVSAVNRGTTRTIRWKGRDYETAFIKEPQDQPVTIRRLGLEGDEQADLTLHGGPDKAVYAYPHDAYEFWQAQLELPAPLRPGAFGENLTVAGLDEEILQIGDVLRVGTALLRVTQPRLPCVKMSACFDRADMPKRFRRAGRSGTYLAVEEDGVVGPGDEFRRVATSGSGWSVREVFEILTTRTAEPDVLERLLALPSLGSGARRSLEERRRS